MITNPLLLHISFIPCEEGSGLEERSCLFTMAPRSRRKQSSRATADNPQRKVKVVTDQHVM